MMPAGHVLVCHENVASTFLRMGGVIKEDASESTPKRKKRKVSE